MLDASNIRAQHDSIDRLSSGKEQGMRLMMPGLAVSIMLNSSINRVDGAVETLTMRFLI